eukprot:9559382-Ditylum_brightwellii.AAC.1
MSRDGYSSSQHPCIGQLGGIGLKKKAFAMKKRHAKCSAEIAEEKKAQIMESKDAVYICKECGKNGDPNICNYCFEDKYSDCETNCKACEQKW